MTAAPLTIVDELLEAADLPAGVCRFCGCTELDACRDVAEGFGHRQPAGCWWIDREQRICSACVAAARAELHHVRALPTAADRRAAWTRRPWCRAFHLGFVVGWFAVSPRTAAGRPTYLRPPSPSLRDAWTRGQQAGEAARQAYGRACGQVTTLPRPAILAAYAGRRPDVRRPPAARRSRVNG